MKLKTHQSVIDEARVYRGENTPDALREAERFLREAMKQHPYALAIGDELVLVLEEQNKDDDAEALLNELQKLFPDPGEETLCRFGKIFKKRGFRRLEEGNPSAAYAAFRESEQKYGLAFDTSLGFYPRINQLTMRFVAASLLQELEDGDRSAMLLDSVRADCEGMLKSLDDRVWRSRLDDDHIWKEATIAELHVLVGNWRKAESAYREAMRLARGQQFYFDCMRDQVTILLAGTSDSKWLSPETSPPPTCSFETRKPKSRHEHVYACPIDTSKVTLPAEFDRALELIADTSTTPGPNSG